MDMDKLPLSGARGEPVKLGVLLGRIVGEAEEGSWLDVNGETYWSIPLVALIKGSTIGVGVFHLERLTREELETLTLEEEDIIAKGERPYDGALDGVIF